MEDCHYHCKHVRIELSNTNVEVKYRVRKMDELT